MEEMGRVVEIQGHKAKVQMKRHASCSQCGACGMGDSPMIEIEVENSIDAQPGQYVIIQMKNSSVLQAAFWVYGLPLVALLLGYAAGAGAARRWGFLLEETSGVIAGFAALALTFAAIRRVDRRLVNARRYLPMMIGLASTAKGLPADNPLKPPIDTPQ